MSDLIDRQAAIDVLSLGKELLSRVLDDMDVVGTDREKYSWGLGLIETYIKDIEELPPAQTESIAIPIINVAKGFDSIEDEQGNTGFGVYDPAEKQIWVAGDLPQEIFAKALFHELMHWIQDITGRPFNEEEANHFSEMVYDSLPSAEPERKKGKWIRTRTMTHDGELYCDQCGQEHPEQKIIWNFCPNCGSYNGGEQE